MASQVLSGSSNVSYTNNTGQNVRIVINYMSGTTANVSGSYIINMNWAGVSASGNAFAIGRNLAFNTGIIGTSSALAANNMLVGAVRTYEEAIEAALPTELMISPGQTFSATCGAYNIVVIPEAG